MTLFQLSTPSSKPESPLFTKDNNLPNPVILQPNLDTLLQTILPHVPQ